MSALKTTFVTWTIKDFDMCPQPPGQAIESPCFSIDGKSTNKLSLLLYPRGYTRRRTGETYVSLYLKRHSDNDENIELCVATSLVDGSNTRRNESKVSGTLSKNTSLGHHDFIERKCLLGPQRLSHFSKNALTVICGIGHAKGSEIRAQICGRKDYEVLASNLAELLESEEHSDMIIRVNGEEFKAHRIILENRWPGLMKLHVKGDNSNCYSMPSIETPVFKSILKCLYTGQFPHDNENLERVFLALNTKELSGLKKTFFPCPHSISASTEIDVFHIGCEWFIRELEVDKEQFCYLVSDERPKWSWLKISVTKTEHRCELKFRWVCESELTIFMQCNLIHNCNKISLEESEHLFENEYEWTTAAQLTQIGNQPLRLDIRVSACRLNSEQSGCVTEDKYIRKYRDVCFDSGDIWKSFLRDLFNMHRNMKNADVTLHVDGRGIPAHKAILSCRSEVFSKMFKHDTIENRTGVVNIDDVDHSTMASLLTYMYYGDIDAPLCVNSAINLYSAADKYQVLLLKQKCHHYLKSQISIANIGDLLLLAGVHEDECLKERCYSFITSHSKEMLSDKHCLDALKSRMDLYPDILNVLLRHICQKSGETCTNCGALSDNNGFTFGASVPGNVKVNSLFGSQRTVQRTSFFGALN